LARWILALCAAVGIPAASPAALVDVGAFEVLGYSFASMERVLWIGKLGLMNSYSGLGLTSAVVVSHRPPGTGGTPKADDLERAASAFRTAVEYEDTLQARTALESARTRLVGARYEEWMELGREAERRAATNWREWKNAADAFRRATSFRNTDEARSLAGAAETRWKALAEDAEYTAHFNRGVELFREGTKSFGSYKKAKAEFEEALKHKDTEEVRKYIRDCDRKWKEAVERK